MLKRLRRLRPQKPEIESLRVGQLNIYSVKCHRIGYCSISGLMRQIYAHFGVSRQLYLFWNRRTVAILYYLHVMVLDVLSLPYFVYLLLALSVWVNQLFRIRMEYSPAPSLLPVYRRSFIKIDDHSAV